LNEFCERFSEDDLRARTWDENMSIPAVAPLLPPHLPPGTHVPTGKYGQDEGSKL